MFFVDFIKLEIKKVTTKPSIHTNTPIPELSQKSAVAFDPTPLVLTEANGSLFKTLPERHIVPLIGKFSLSGNAFYRAYLSQGDGAFLHLTVSNFKPNEITECRLYQPYHEVIPLYVDADSTDGVAVASDLLWSNWLLDNPDPAVGGIIGCPTVNSKNDDIDSTTGQPYLYYRSWESSDAHINPKIVTEQTIGTDGQITITRHRMMHYERLLNDGKQKEYLLISCSEMNPDAENAAASVIYWVGIDIDKNDLTVYPPPK